MSAFWFAAIFLIQSQITGQVQPGAVSGRLLSVNGTPEAGVRIAAVPVDPQNNAGAPVLVGISQTDAEGRYRLEGIPPGRYYIFAGLIDLPSYYPNAKTLDQATAITVEAGSTVSGIDFSMARPVALRIAGRLAVPSTMQLGAGRTVTLTSQTRGTAPSSQQSIVRGDGSFEFPRVSPGEYRVASNLPGSSAAYVKVADVDVVDVVLSVVDCNAGTRVSGRLTGNSTTKVQSISLIGSSGGCTLSTRIEADGSFTFSRVPEGGYQYRLTPAPLGWSSSILVVGKDDLIGVEVALPALVTIRGRAEVDDGSVIPRMARGAPLTVVARSNSGEIAGSIQEDGEFELQLPKGRYRISVPGIPSGYYLKWMTSGFADLPTSVLDVGDAPAENIELMLGLVRLAKPSGVRVSGHLTFAPTGALPKSEGVLLVSAGKRNAAVHESSLAPDGSFEFSGVVPGIYNLETFPDNPAALYGIVVERTDVTGIEFAVPTLVNVKGGIEWADSQGAGVSAPQPSVSVQFTRKEGNRVLAWGALAQSGAFHFYLPEGDYRFSVSDLPPNFDLGSVTLGDANVLEDGLRVKADSDSPNLRVILRGK